MTSKPVFNSEPRLLDNDDTWVLKRVAECLETVLFNVKEGHVAGPIHAANRRALNKAITLLNKYEGRHTPQPVTLTRETVKETLRVPAVEPAVNKSWLQQQADALTEAAA